jgi:hypothetical protein
MKINKPEELSISNIKFSELKKQGKGGFVSYINYTKNDKSTKYLIQTPKMFAPFGASTYKKEELPKGQIPKYTVPLALDEKDKKIKMLKEFFVDLDALVLKTAIENPDWQRQLGQKNVKKVSVDKLEMLYTKIVKESNNNKYPDTFTPKVPIIWKTSLPALELYSKSKQKFEVTFDNIEDLLPRLSEIKCLIQVSHVWFVSKKFGVTLKIVQGVVSPKELCGYSIMDSSDEESEEEEL